MVLLSIKQVLLAEETVPERVVYDDTLAMEVSIILAEHTDSEREQDDFSSDTNDEDVIEDRVTVPEVLLTTADIFKGRKYL